MKKIYICVIALMLSVFFSCFDDKKDPYDLLPLNHIQVIGSHNSYKQAIHPTIIKFLKEEDSSASITLDYSHISIKDQLDLGLLNLEIDVHADAKGGIYAQPFGLKLLKDESITSAVYDPAGVMNAPGFKVFHIQGIDFRSECLTFDRCLSLLKTWSDAHKDHLPVFVTINAKDGASRLPEATIPEKFTSSVFDQLDNVLLSALGREKLIIPEDLKGQYATLEEAVLNGNWPLVKDARGKFIFLLDESNQKRTAYIKNHPSLEGRYMFVNAQPGMHEAAILIMNAPKEQQSAIREMVLKGYIVRTRADANTIEARNNDRSRFEMAMKSGAHIITTDYYYPSTHFKSDYKINFQNGKYIRINPLFKSTQN